MKFLQRTFKKTIRTLQKMDACTRICLMLGIILLIVILFNKLPVIENFENNTQIKQTGKYVVKNNNELYDDFKSWYEDTFSSHKYPSKVEFKKYLKKKYTGGKKVDKTHLKGFVFLSNKNMSHLNQKGY